MTLRHVLVIATRNRPSDMKDALTSVVRSNLLPSQIVIVDSSDTGDTADLVGEYQSSMTGELTWLYVHTEPGLPRQRNVGIGLAEGDVIHFIDDDVVLDVNYFACLDQALASAAFEDVVGVGGLVTALGPPRRPRWWWRAFQLDSVRQGVVLPSGVNIITSHVDEPTDVAWLSGCSMSYRISIFDRLRFDEQLAGYALMEDADFSFRAAAYGRLVVLPEARLVHKVSQVERWSHQRRHRASVYRRYWFVRKNMPIWHIVAFGWSVIGSILLEGLLGLLSLKRYRVRVALWRAQGVIDMLRGAR